MIKDSIQLEEITREAEEKRKIQFWETLESKIKAAAEKSETRVSYPVWEEDLRGITTDDIYKPLLKRNYLPNLQYGGLADSGKSYYTFTLRWDKEARKISEELRKGGKWSWTTRFWYLWNRIILSLALAVVLVGCSCENPFKEGEPYDTLRVEVLGKEMKKKFDPVDQMWHKVYIVRTREKDFKVGRKVWEEVSDSLTLIKYRRPIPHIKVSGGS